MSLGNWLWPSRRRQLLSAASASLKIMASAVLLERQPLARTVRWRMVGDDERDSKFKGTAALKKKIDPTRVSIEKEGKHPVVKEHEAGDRGARRARAVCSYRRSRKRHLRAFCS